MSSSNPSHPCRKCSSCGKQGHKRKSSYCLESISLKKCNKCGIRIDDQQTNIYQNCSIFNETLQGLSTNHSMPLMTVTQTIVKCSACGISGHRSDSMNCHKTLMQRKCSTCGVEGHQRNSCNVIITGQLQTLPLINRSSCTNCPGLIGQDHTASTCNPLYSKFSIHHGWELWINIDGSLGPITYERPVFLCNHND
jgi:hypothetical protein